MQLLYANNTTERDKPIKLLVLLLYSIPQFNLENFPYTLVFLFYTPALKRNSLRVNGSSHLKFVNIYEERDTHKISKMT